MIPLLFLLMLLGFAVVVLLSTFPAAVFALVALVVWRAAARRRTHRSDPFVRAMLDR